MSIFQPQGAIGSHSNSFKSALIRIAGIPELLRARTVTVSGEGGVSSQVMQDFEGTPYFTVFGNKIATFTIDCLDIGLVGCSDRRPRSSDIDKISRRLKNDARTGKLSIITMSCTEGMVMTGYLVSMSFRIQRPSPSYRLTVIGAMGS